MTETPERGAPPAPVTVPLMIPEAASEKLIPVVVLPAATVTGVPVVTDGQEVLQVMPL